MYFETDVLVSRKQATTAVQELALLESILHALLPCKRARPVTASALLAVHLSDAHFTSAEDTHEHCRIGALRRLDARVSRPPVPQTCLRNSHSTALRAHERPPREADVRLTLAQRRTSRQHGGAASVAPAVAHCNQHAYSASCAARVMARRAAMRDFRSTRSSPPPSSAPLRLTLHARSHVSAVYAGSQ